jgi:hypothetical protein
VIEIEGDGDYERVKVRVVPEIGASQQMFLRLRPADSPTPALQ